MDPSYSRTANKLTCLCNLALKRSLIWRCLAVPLFSTEICATQWNDWHLKAAKRHGLRETSVHLFRIQRSFFFKRVATFIFLDKCQPYTREERGRLPRKIGHSLQSFQNEIWRRKCYRYSVDNTSTVYTLSYIRTSYSAAEAEPKLNVVIFFHVLSLKCS